MARSRRLLADARDALQGARLEAVGLLHVVHQTFEVAPEHGLAPVIEGEACNALGAFVPPLRAEAGEVDLEVGHRIVNVEQQVRLDLAASTRRIQLEEELVVLHNQLHLVNVIPSKVPMALAIYHKRLQLH